MTEGSDQRHDGAQLPEEPVVSRRSGEQADRSISEGTPLPPFFAGDAKPSEQKEAPAAEEEALRSPGPAGGEEPSVEVAEEAAGVEQTEAPAADAGPLYPFDEPGPGSPSAPSAPPAHVEPAEPAAAPQPSAEPVEPAPADEEPQPFDDAVLEPTGAGAEDDGDDFPVDAFDLPGKGGAAGRSDLSTSPTRERAAETAPPDFLAPEPAEPPAPATAPEEEHAPDFDEPAPAPRGDSARVAAMLEELARSLRSEGESALTTRIASADRLESIVAGVLASYFAGRND